MKNNAINDNSPEQDLRQIDSLIEASTQAASNTNEQLPQQVIKNVETIDRHQASAKY
jgi:hypothetical protein